MRRFSSPPRSSSYKRRRSSSYDRKTSKYRKEDSQSSSSSQNVNSRNNETEFSFTNYKRDLNKIISYSSESNTVANNLDDFWVFLKKYEATLKKSGKPLLDKQNEEKNLNDIGVPRHYSKYHCINFSTKLKYVDVVSDDRDRRKLDKEMFEAFLNIVSIYIDFKNKEKFEKLRKLKQAQKDLPVASYR